MGTPCDPSPVRLFAGIMFGETFETGPVLEKMERRFGKAGPSYGPLPFSWTDYYAKEMDGRLRKLYVFFADPIRRDDLPDIKRWTNDLEREYAEGEKRKVNIDPGYLARDKLVLATTKDFFHRLYLGKGIYGEVTLHFQKGAVRHFSWTYPDYRDTRVQEFLMKERNTNNIFK
ncbi:MAG: DUF4416 family protein [Chitinispirillaceae bacterium]|nr:DUF4416 family protein [Chitinispirillaceae bacterium]